MDRLEKDLWALGYSRVAGVDEAGRGPLAGPVAAAAVVFDPDRIPTGINDSKKLSAEARERLYDLIVESAAAHAVTIKDHAEIDRTNILRASLAAMLEAVDRLSPPADFILVDGNQKILTWTPQRTVVGGDAKSVSVAAASILAKVTRDRMMAEMDALYPGYGFARHKGYGTAEHLEALRRLGPCPIHRRTFGGVKELL